VQSYLHVDIHAEPEAAKKPIPPSKLKHLVKFALWLFGNEKTGVQPIITDSRKVDMFGKVLESPKAVKYLESADSPKFETAYRIAGGDATDVAESVEQANLHLEEALGVIHHVKGSARVREASERMVRNVARLVTIYPEFKTMICEGD
jgi:hypothetical protein